MAGRQNDNTPGDAHELTFSCYKQLKLLESERTRNWFLESLDESRVKLDFSVWAYVIMPEHVHVIVWPRTAPYDISDIRQAIKGPVARKAITYLRANHKNWLPNLTRIRGSREECLFWQSGGGYDRSIRTATALHAMIDYIHQNPVRRGLAEQAKDWPWSSAAAFEGGTSLLAPDPVDATWIDGTS